MRLTGKFRVCLLLDDGGGQTTAVFEPEGDEPFELLHADALASGLVALKAALAGARRVIEAGRAEREAWIRSAQLAELDVSGIDDQSSAYSRALANFERAHGKGHPFTEDLTKL